MGGERTHGRREDKWEERGHMGGERAHGRREDTWEERGHMGGERAHGREKGTWEERGHMGGEDTWEERGHMRGERTHGRRENTWEVRGHMGGERAMGEERTHGRREVYGTHHSIISLSPNSHKTLHTPTPPMCPHLHALTRNISHSPSAQLQLFSLCTTRNQGQLRMN